jgi:hypothetical protein
LSMRRLRLFFFIEMNDTDPHCLKFCDGW